MKKLIFTFLVATTLMLSAKTFVPVFANSHSISTEKSLIHYIK
ncbi:MAG: hypothetical protein RSB38_01185 [Oscillospiraceae bacterium]